MINLFLKWWAISFVAWPIIVVSWGFIVIPLFKRWVLDVGKPGFAPMISSIASTALWVASVIVLLNSLFYIVTISSATPSSIGLSVKLFSDIIPIYYAIPLAVLALELNALANKWSK
jgi:hypothetical protein